MLRQRLIGVGVIALGGGLALSAILGPLIFNVIRFQTSANLVSRFTGADIVSLEVVAPVAVTAGILWLRGHRLAPALTLTPTLYAIYTSITVVLGQEYRRYPGNVERFLPLYAGLIGGGAILGAAAWSALGRQPTPSLSSRLRHVLAGSFFGMSGFIALLWLQQIRLALIGQPPSGYVDAPALFWAITMLDFGFVMPAGVVTAIGLLRQWPVAIKAAYGLSGFLTCWVGSMAGMAMAMAINHDPSVHPALLVLLSMLTTALAGVAMAVLRSSLRPVAPSSGRPVKPVAPAPQPRRRLT